MINGTNLVGSLCNCGSNGSYVCTFIDFHAAERFGNLLGCDGRYVVCFLQNACIDQCFSCVFSNRNGTVCHCDAGCLVQVLQARNFCIASLIGYNADLIVYDVVTGSLNQEILTLKLIHLFCCCGEEYVAGCTLFNLCHQGS